MIDGDHVFAHGGRLPQVHTRVLVKRSRHTVDAQPGALLVHQSDGPAELSVWLVFGRDLPGDVLRLERSRARASALIG